MYVCGRWLTYILGDIAYTSFFQDHLTPADYFRDPLQSAELQAAKIFLADINNEDDKDASISGRIHNSIPLLYIYINILFFFFEYRNVQEQLCIHGKDHLRQS